MRRPLAGLLLAFLVASAPGSAEFIWRGGLEPGATNEWKGARRDGRTVVTAPGRPGKYPLGRDGPAAAPRGKPSRIERQHQPAPPGTAEGTDRYFGWSVYLPK